MNDSVKRFVERRQLFSAEKDKLEKDSDRLSSIRFFFFCTAALLTILAFIYIGNKAGAIILGISLILFLILIVKHEKVIKQVNYYRNMAEINHQCIQRIEGDWNSFKDDGSEFIDADHRYTGDLDIFGPASLFQWINTANTFHGREFTRNLLENPQKDMESIGKRQNAIKELALKLEFCQVLQCAGMENKDFTKNPESLFAYAESTARFFNKEWVKYFFYLLPAATLLSLAGWYLNGLLFTYLSLILFAIQLMINIWGSQKVNNILATVYGYKTRVSVYQGIFAILEKEEFADAYLLELQACLFEKKEPASQLIKSLDKIVGAIGFKYNPIVYFFINNVFLWEFHCLFALEKWQDRAGSSLRNWVYNLGRFECLSTMALIAQLNPRWCYPEFDEGKLLLTAGDLGHPLINARDRVANHLAIENQICIVTGSNMSGKTTLLRTIGVNLVLAYAGGPVCAQEFRCSFMEIFTSMRIRDDLNHGISTFYAELLRIKMIVDFSRKQIPMIFLIDEVFRGTNSLDRVAGARNVLMNLNRDWIIGLVSTHDYELCEFVNDKSGRIKNYHFIETYVQNEIRFD
ncbi:MAG: DNA mismatch repair protein MutS [Syntrophomonadaceae bacterium]|nr:DNA mismatch repair protein MutS [Syntrophomonadaceae bacterium]